MGVIISHRVRLNNSILLVVDVIVLIIPIMTCIAHEGDNNRVQEESVGGTN